LFRGYIFDLDGTIYLGPKLLPGAMETVAGLKASGCRICYLSNKPLETREVYARKLTGLGIETAPSDVINSSFVMTRYLLDHFAGARLFVIGEAPFLGELRAAGFEVTEEPGAVDIVVAAFDRTFDYRKLNIAFQAIRRGARFFATNPDRACPVEGGFIPDCAGVIGAIEGVTGKTVEVVVGKPSHLICKTALNHMGLAARDCLLVGDRLETDILMGEKAGVRTALVLTGATGEDDLANSAIAPDFVLRDLRELLTLSPGKADESG
jgi:NagD protein